MPHLKRSGLRNLSKKLHYRVPQFWGLYEETLHALNEKKQVTGGYSAYGSGKGVDR